MVNPNRFPIYIPSYSRLENNLTAQTLDSYGMEYHLVVEPEQKKLYEEYFPDQVILPIPSRYHREYDTFDDLGETKSQGPGPARNYAWEHSLENGFEYHWVMDDNIHFFYRRHKNKQIPWGTGIFFKIMEDFVLRYTNIAMSGPRYFIFSPRKMKRPPLTFNTRIYSCNLIQNNVPYRWRGRYNEDTDLSLRMLMDGWCTVIFNTILQGKMTTQVVKGGNDERFYSLEGTYPKSEMQLLMHPTVTSLVWKYGRWHHWVDYTPFKKNKLIHKDPKDIPKDAVNQKYDFTIKRIGGKNV